MAYLSKVAFVLWKPDYDELCAELNNVSGGSEFFRYIKEPQYMTTPDETYVKAEFNGWVKWYDGEPLINCISNFLSRVRHSFIRIGEENGDIEIDNEVSDDRGIDEEFDYFLTVSVDIDDDGFVAD